ncbi:MAG: GatB/YqeY domain-containing protein [Gemmatimonadaceae bacterium]|nr:GatB/YqeY domain-containing protein [Gemmatimonadaceae bacterium]
MPPTETHARLSGDLLVARKAQDKPAILLLGTILAEVKERVRVIENEEKREVADSDVIDVLRKAIKRRRESAEQYDKAARPELAQRERDEITAIERYLPAAVDPEVIRGAVREAIAGGLTAVGPVMGRVLGRFKGQVEGSVVNAIVREELARNA